MLKNHFDKNNLHHAYLIEGARDEIVPEILAFLQSLNIKTTSNPDFVTISIDSFKIDDAFSLRAMASNKGFTEGKKIFILCLNSATLDAQNVLLKMFEEPIEDTHFFLVVPDTHALLKTLISRFYFIATKDQLIEEKEQAEKFIAMPLKSRIEFIKELLAEADDQDEEGNEIVALDSNRSKAIKFLNALETILNHKLVKNFSGLLHPSGGTFPVQNSLPAYFEHIFKVREFLRMPGSSTKTLMESVALAIPDLPAGRQGKI